MSGTIGGERLAIGGAQSGAVAVELPPSAEQLQDAPRLPLAAYLDRIDRACLDRLGREHRGSLADQDGHVIEARHLLDTRRQIDAVADQRVAAGEVRADAADDNVAAGYPDAQPDRRQPVHSD